MIIRRVETKDIEAIDEIYSNAKKFMRENGNASQWSQNYPSGEDARRDMQEGVSYVCEENGEILAAFMFKIGEEPNYKNIYCGSWLNEKPYAVIHRIAVKRNGKGIVNFCFDECFKICPNIKIDTHRDNIPMQKALSKAGFKRCGIIYLENGDERIAFQKSI